MTPQNMRKSTIGKPSTANGMTLIELMMTLSIVAVVVALMSSGDFRKLIDEAWMWSSTNKVVSCLQLAKSEAVTRNIDVYICASNDQSSCSNDVAGWESGSIVTSDPSGSGSLFSVCDPMPEGQTVSADCHSFVFSPDGTPNGLPEGCDD